MDSNAQGKNSNDFEISVIVPSFNEQETIPILAERLVSTLTKYNEYEIIFVDDGRMSLKEIRAQKNLIGTL
jgi:cellulose synthase/poly-beta-1,6-N-acetylglucosamine synthase-like glycosyltransferase